MNNLQKIKGYLIEEAAYSSKPEIMHQSHDGPVKIKVTLQDADIPNRNNRIYTKKGLEFGINTPYAKERLQHKAWYGEAGKLDCQII